MKPHLHIALLLGLSACVDPSDAPRVQLPVIIDGSMLQPVINDRGYELKIESLRLSLHNIVFTIAGEVHSRAKPYRPKLISRAHAHPGHHQGGEVTGELPGHFVIEWPANHNRSLGQATLIAGRYRAANFSFGHGTHPSLSPEDPLKGHTATLRGTATKMGVTTTFQITVDAPKDRKLIGAPFEAQIKADPKPNASLRFIFNTRDTLEGDTLFDGIDFGALDRDQDGFVTIAPGIAEVENAYHTFRRVFLSHDHYRVMLQE